jgi:SNF2 family DNA or RNA helicase
MGLRVGNEVIAIPRDKAEELLTALTDAEAEGRPVVECGGASIPVSRESIDSARVLVEAARGEPPSNEEPLNQVESADAKIVALIADNIDEATYTRTPREVPRLRDELPMSLKSTLFDFQQHGFRWMQQLWLSGAPGGILADDMGLGKTVQTLAFLAWVREVHDDHKPILIVGPTGLLRNWQAEHRQHLHEPGLGELIEAHGTGLAQLRLTEAGRRGELHTGFASLDLAELRRADWVLTTYENLRDYQHSFAQVPWRVVVFDEAQRIKNPEVMTTEAAKALNAELTLAVTGTPVENHLIDLWCIADTAQPGMLGSLKDFAQKYQPQGQSGPEALEELRLRVQERNPPPLMLRRLKQDHLHGLPGINAHVERVTMPPVQAERYDRAVAAARKNGPRNLSGILEALQQMRSVSLHPSLEHVGSDEAFIESSARLKHTIAVLDRLATTGEKALVFVEAIAMQDVLVELLQRRYKLPAPPIVINGELAGHKRKSRVDAFQQRHGFDVMLLSPRAGGVGLTITEANHVIHLSRWWNPAVEDQATDRVYRIGQRRDVHVHLPLAIHPQLGDGSFDALLHALLERKRALSRGVLAPAVSTEGELKDLFAASVAARP